MNMVSGFHQSENICLLLLFIHAYLSKNSLDLQDKLGLIYVTFLCNSKSLHF